MADLAVVDAGELEVVEIRILRGVSNSRVAELEQYNSREKILVC